MTHSFDFTLLQVFQRRQDGSQDFNQGEQVYKDGFGDLCGEFWWGLDKIKQLTKYHSGLKLLVELTDFDGATAWTEYTLSDVVQYYGLEISNNDAGTAGWCNTTIAMSWRIMCSRLLGLIYPGL